MICQATSSTKAAKKSAVPAKYPQLSVMVTVSPPVSPNVVAAILMIQKASVTSGTLLNDSDIFLRVPLVGKTTSTRPICSPMLQCSICDVCAPAYGGNAELQNARWLTAALCSRVHKN